MRSLVDYLTLPWTVRLFEQHDDGVYQVITVEELAGQTYHLDLLLHHRRLRCLVAVELKIGEFLPEYVGKMQFYLAVLDDTVRMPEENPSIGIILCKSKTATVVEYALRESNQPIGVASYRVVSTLPRELQGELPAPEQVAKLLEGVEE